MSMEGKNQVKPWQIALAALIVVVSLAGQATIKAGLNDIAKAPSENWTFSRVLIAGLKPLILTGFLLMTISAISYLWLLRTTDFTRALPVMGAIGYILIPIYGYVFLREVMSARQFAGIGLLLISIFLMRK